MLGLELAPPIMTMKLCILVVAPGMDVDKVADEEATVVVLVVLMPLLLRRTSGCGLV